MSAAEGKLALDVIGMGLVSPLAMTPAQHVAFARADASMAASGAFLRRDGDPVDALYCAWLEPRLSLGERLAELGARAAEDATRGVAPSRIPTVLISEAPWSGLEQAALDVMRSRLEGLGLALRASLCGAAAIADALHRAERLLVDAPAVLVVAADSFISPAALSQRAPDWSSWERSGPPASEAAAALLVGRASQRRVGRILWASDAEHSSMDDNDEPTTGAALTSLLRRADRQLSRSYGQRTVDLLREQSWEYAASRCPELLGADHVSTCIEDRAGRVGAAAGLLHLLVGLADEGADQPFGSWVISRDGRRSLTVAEADR